MGWCRFIDRYLEFTKNTETPELIHIWSAVSTLAGTAERRLWLDRGMFKLYGNLYIILVGNPGVIAKSTSIGYMSKMLEDVGCYAIDQVATKEKIVCELAEHGTFYIKGDIKFPHTSVTYCMSELNTLLVAGQDMVLFLTSIWDKYDIFKYKTKTSGEFEVVNPYFNLIGAATTEWFVDAMDSRLISTGFLARCIVVYGRHARGRISKPTLSDKARAARAECLMILRWIKEQFGEVGVDASAEAVYDDWYTSLPIDYGNEPKIGHYYVRKAKVFVLKVAMLFALGDMSLVVRKEHIEKSLELFEITEPAIKACYMLAGTNKLAPFARMLVGLILASEGKGVGYADILQTFYNDISPDDMAEVVNMLKNMGLVYIDGSLIKAVDDKQCRLFLGDV